MEKEKVITVTELLDKAAIEIDRLGYSRSAGGEIQSYLRDFALYCEIRRIKDYDLAVGQDYLLHKHGIKSVDARQKLTVKQRDVRLAIRVIDDIYHFGYARKPLNHTCKLLAYHSQLLDEYLDYCVKSGGSAGTNRVKLIKLRDFFLFVEGRGIALSDLTAAYISDFMVTLAGYSRATIHIYTSVLSCFFRYLKDRGILETDLSPMIPKPRMYAEESIPETWTTDEVQQLLSAIDRTGGVGKRDYAMILLAVILGMRVGDINALMFENLDWNRKLITYVQQKTSKTNTLPLLPEIGEAIIDYLKNGRLESDSKNVFIRHIPPYSGLGSSSALSCNIKRYMRMADLKVKDRKAAHSLRHTLASSLLSSGTPLMTISNILGHYNPRATVGYTKVDVPSLRKCSLSYGAKAVTQ